MEQKQYFQKEEKQHIESLLTNKRPVSSKMPEAPEAQFIPLCIIVSDCVLIGARNGGGNDLAPRYSPDANNIT